MKQQFFIFGYYGWKNTGDDAMGYALLKELYTLYPSAIFFVLAPNPIIIPPEVKGKVEFVRPGLQMLFRELLNSSSIIIGGGTHIHDYYHSGSKAKRLKVLLGISILLLWAKLLRKDIYILGNGFGPISTIWCRFILKSICRLSDFISVRDEVSYRILKELGVKNKVVSAFDLSALLEPVSVKEDILRKRTNNGKILGISILPFFEIYHNNKEKDIIFVEEIAKALNEWMKRDPRAMVYLFIFKGKSKDDDVVITEMLQKRLYNSGRVKLIPHNPDPVKMLSLIAQCDTFIGMRYHSCIFAYLNGIPMLIIDYLPKCKAIAESIGLPSHAVVSVEEILNGQFENYLKDMQEHPDDFVAALPVSTARQMAKNGLPMDENLGFSPEGCAEGHKVYGNVQKRGL